MRAKKAAQNVYAKIQRLFDAASMRDVISKGDLVAVKVHIGTGENHRHLKPQHIRAVVDKIKEAGGDPFVTETTGIGLAASRGTAVGCIRTAILHGFTPETLGAPLIIADGLKGLWGIKIKTNGMICKEVEIAQSIVESDAMISVSHAKGHPRTGFAASLKNIGIGCVTKPYKGQFHLALKPSIDQKKCNDCGICIDFCPVEAIQRINGKPQVIEKKCIWGCGCWDVCPQKAFSKWNDMHHKQNKELIIRNVDAASAVFNHFGKDKLAFMNLAYDITPHCDCADYGDVPMVPDIGIFASRDPIAIDKATSDAIINSPGNLGSASEEVSSMESGDDKFSKLSEWAPFQIFKTDDMTREWRVQLVVGEKLGLGTQKYDLIKID
ncbi:hypothetical protein AC481_06870 [miscellaneous Crenarchaeota group archaeon SMTZ-80]|nr:MAG: hypothetical protein AC481_06870 [miscellaneous Crenarchaeota group archaeon SMTZ-80]